MKATEFLKQDHQTVSQLFQQFRESEGQDISGKREIFQLIRTELEVHAQIEEQLFYPAVKACGGEVAEKVEEGIDEHKMMEDLLGECLEVQGDEEFITKVTELIGIVEHHVEEEENELFPLVEQSMGAENLEELCGQLEGLKAELIEQDLGESIEMGVEAQSDDGVTGISVESGSYETSQAMRSGEFGIGDQGQQNV